MQKLELGYQHSVQSLRDGLKQSDKIVYHSNGNRAFSAKVFLNRVKPVLAKAGITRIGDISFLSATHYPVFQSCRPNIFYHTAIGQNTGSQGKGPHSEQATLSCMMEAIEGYCAEPRNSFLVRASYDFLRSHQVVLNPQKYVSSINAEKVQLDEPVMWTKAYHVQMDCEILIPAEVVFYPFLSKLYRTQPHFPSSTNGLASGATYLEATTHALYEVIERYYNHLFDLGKVQVEAIYEEELIQKGIEETKAAVRGEYELQLYSLEIPGIKNLPMIMCLLVGDQDTYYGMGCSARVDVSIDRAISEALQSQATVISGGREDLETDEISLGQVPLFENTPQPEKRSLRIGHLRKRVYDRDFRSLRDEFQFLIRWLKNLGYEHTLIANLTRAGLDLPVVKVIIPDMDSIQTVQRSSQLDSQSLLKYQFPNIVD